MVSNCSIMVTRTTGLNGEVGAPMLPISLSKVILKSNKLLGKPYIHCSKESDANYCANKMTEIEIIEKCNCYYGLITNRVNRDGKRPVFQNFKVKSSLKRLLGRCRHRFLWRMLETFYVGAKYATNIKPPKNIVRITLKGTALISIWCHVEMPLFRIFFLVETKQLKICVHQVVKPMDLLSTA